MLTGGGSVGSTAEPDGTTELVFSGLLAVERVGVEVGSCLVAAPLRDKLLICGR